MAHGVYQHSLRGKPRAFLSTTAQTSSLVRQPLSVPLPLEQRTLPVLIHAFTLAYFAMNLLTAYILVRGKLAIISVNGLDPAMCEYLTCCTFNSKSTYP